MNDATEKPKAEFEFLDHGFEGILQARQGDGIIERQVTPIDRSWIARLIGKMAAWLSRNG